MRNCKDKLNIILFVVLATVQLVLYIYCANYIHPVHDGVLSLTLSNNPYEALFMGCAIDDFPNENGWFDAQILRDNYIVSESTRFDYNIPYYHQLNDVHPLVYAFMVFTISSIFCGQYSPWILMGINILFILLIDILLYYLGKRYLGGNSIGLLIAFSLSYYLLGIMVYPRNYIVLLFECFLYFALHLDMLQSKVWSKKHLYAFSALVFFGGLTHYYFYVFAAGVSLTCVILFAINKQGYRLVNYIFAGVFGFEASLIVFPWVFKHIFLNTGGKHKELHEWNLTWVKNCLQFYNERFFNDRFVWLMAIVIVALIVIIMRNQKSKLIFKLNLYKKEIILIIASFVFYAVILSILDGYHTFYLTPLLVPVTIGIVGVLGIFIKCAAKGDENKTLVPAFIVVAVVCVLWFSKATEFRKQVETDGIAYNQFHSVAKQYAGNDVIYVSPGCDTEYANLLFEIGEFNKIKHINTMDFDPGKISEYLVGRQNDHTVIMYIPSEISINTSDADFLAEYNNNKVYKMID